MSSFSDKLRWSGWPLNITDDQIQTSKAPQQQKKNAPGREWLPQGSRAVLRPVRTGREATLARRPGHRKLELFESQIADDPVCLSGNSAGSAFIICARIQPTKPASHYSNIARTLLW